MTSSIDKQTLIDAFYKYPNVTWSTLDILEKINGLQTIEHPEIIRCKDCKHYNAGFECLIEGYGIERNKNWYCADAEKRLNE